MHQSSMTHIVDIFGLKLLVTVDLEAIYLYIEFVVRKQRATVIWTGGVKGKCSPKLQQY